MLHASAALRHLVLKWSSTPSGDEPSCTIGAPRCRDVGVPMVYPGTSGKIGFFAYSEATMGCNLNAVFCHDYDGGSEAIGRIEPTRTPHYNGKATIRFGFLT